MSKKVEGKPGSRRLRSLDRLFGIPLIRILGWLSRPLGCPAHVGRVALLKGDGMGDLVILTGPLGDLRRKFPKAVISLFGSDSVVPLGRELRLLDETHLIDFSRPWQALSRLRAWKPDVVIDCGQWSRTEPLLAGLSGAKFVIGFDTPGEKRHHLYDAPIAHRDDCHELENFRRLLRPLGIIASHPPVLNFGEEVLPRVIKKDPYVVFHMWPSGLTHASLKEWPAENWSALAQACSETGLHVVLTGGSQDAQRSAEWISRQDKNLSLTNKCGLPIRETIEVLRNAEAVVSVNTGVMHLAAALDVPTVGLHGPTNERRWGALGERARDLAVPPPDGGYLNLGFEYPADADVRRGMETILPSRVIDVLAELTHWFGVSESHREVALAGA